jgi:hypothetical protein
VDVANNSPHPQNILLWNLGYTERMMTNLATFARRQNQDHFLDSIPMICYQTIAKDGDSVSAEQGHICNPYGEFNQHQVDFQLERPTVEVARTIPAAMFLV